MTEKVRMLVWDLDETFWKGTLTEGGIQIQLETCELVKTLARRGIMSSICSKNNFDDVKNLLEREGVWDYFILPSINWEPKGPRIAALIEAVQLRSPTVMFIDDNPLNLEEVKHFVPDIQVRSHEFVPCIAESELFVGKDDQALSRLQQYKLLEVRKKDEKAAGADVVSFLRASDIRVELVRDLGPHLDRVIELVNRTNQLNFTKTRFSEDQDEARRQARELLGRYNVQAALVRVKDKYGDHGFTGLYVMNSEHNFLLHFCFSCRILGMGVEQWIYNLIGRPKLTIKGEVLSDPADLGRPIEWINEGSSCSDAGASERLSVSRMVAHGGCDLSAVAHYFGVHGVAVVPEFNLMRNNTALRTDHSVFLKYARSGLTREQREVAEKLQYTDQDFQSALFLRAQEPQCALLSFATDAHYALYHHRKTGLRVPCLLGLGPVSTDQRSYNLPAGERDTPRAKMHQLLREEFEFCGLTGETEFKDTLRETFSTVGSSIRVFVVLPSENHINKGTGETYSDPSFVAVNDWTKQVSTQFSNVSLSYITDFVESVAEIDNILHYDRMVYYRLYKKIANDLAVDLE